MRDPLYVAGVMIRSSVCPRLCVGMLTCCFKLNVVIVSKIFVHLDLPYDLCEG